MERRTPYAKGLTGSAASFALFTANYGLATRCAWRRADEESMDHGGRTIEALAADPDRLFALSHGATERAESFLWDVNHKRVNQIYSDLVYGPGAPNAEADRLAAVELANTTEVHAL